MKIVNHASRELIDATYSGQIEVNNEPEVSETSIQVLDEYNRPIPTQYSNDIKLLNPSNIPNSEYSEFTEDVSEQQLKEEDSVKDDYQL